MAGKSIHILRVRCDPLPQGGLFDVNRSKADVIRDAILSRPTAKVRRGTEWHIGDTEEFAEKAIAFQLGRKQSVNAPQFDEYRQIFFETDAERAPYTWGVFDAKTQACAIVKQSGVSLNAYEIGRKLEELLNSSVAPNQSGFCIVVDVLKDPEEFIEQMANAESIAKFSFTADFENPHDVESLIQRPAEKFAKVSGARKATVEVEGDNLEKDVLEDLARSVASVGAQAAASIKNVGQRGLKRIFLKGTPLLEQLDEEALKDKAFSTILASLRVAYSRLRRSIND